jgi:hypothetical protein
LASEGDLAAAKAVLEKFPQEQLTARIMRNAVQRRALPIVEYLKAEYKEKPSSEKLRLMGASADPGGSVLYFAMSSPNSAMMAALLDRTWWNDEMARLAFIDFHHPGGTPILKITWNSEAAALVNLLQAARKECEAP